MYIGLKEHDGIGISFRSKIYPSDDAGPDDYKHCILMWESIRFSFDHFTTNHQSAKTSLDCDSGYYFVIKKLVGVNYLF